MEQPELFTIERTAINFNCYRNSLSFTRQHFDKNPTLSSAKTLSHAYLHSLLNAMEKDAGLLISSSTGKDSTLMCVLYCNVILQRKKLGLTIPNTTIGIADTGSEFPEMQDRLYRQRDLILKWAKANDLPIDVLIEKPPVKNRLLPQIIGNGRPLPSLGKNGGNAMGSSAQWCMSYVKGEPIKRIEKKIKAKHPLLVQMIGTRSSESSARKLSVEKYATDFPEGLSAIGSHMGSTPIVHWTNDMLDSFLRSDVAPWDAGSVEDLANIYYKASSKGEMAGECAISLDKDNGVTNTCSDLGGARMGCFFCVKSVNKSLTNMTRRKSETESDYDRAERMKYRWLRGFHSYLYGLHKRYSSGATGKKGIITQVGKNTVNLFCKNLPFLERARLLLLLFRAELESGLVLVSPEDLQMIKAFWGKAGVYHVDPEEIRADAQRWKETGKPELSYLKAAAYLDRSNLTTTLPGGSFFHLSDEIPQGTKCQPLSLVNQLAFRNAPMPLLPLPKAYVFRRRDHHNGDLLVMVTDMPSVLGAKTSTGLLNGIAPFAWVYQGSRDLLEWEWHLLNRGRNFFYQQTREEDTAALVAYSEDLTESSVGRQRLRGHTYGLFPHRGHIEIGQFNRFTSALENLVTVTRGEGCADLDPLTLAVDSAESIGAMRGKLSLNEIRRLQSIVTDLAYFSDETDEAVHVACRTLEAMCAGNWELMEHVAAKGVKRPKHKADFQAKVRMACKRMRLVDGLQSGFKEYNEQMRYVIELIKAGRLNGAVVGKLAYIARMFAVDEEYAEREFSELLRQLVKNYVQGNSI